MSLGGLGGDTASVVAALRAVPGVADAEILPEPGGGPGTLRLQLAPGADEVLVATTVHRLLGERFGLGVDAGRVQVVEEAVTSRTHAAQPSSVPTDVAPPTQGPTVGGGGPQLRGVSTTGAPAETAWPGRTRLLIHKMQLVSAQQGVTSEVTLQLLGRDHTGSADAATTPTSVHRSVALATLRAVEEALGRRVRFELEHLETAVLGGDRAVLVEVSMITRHGSERLTGVSAVREDARQAVIRATLDALNRRIETFLAPA
jgi:hypothetical protein